MKFAHILCGSALCACAAGGAIAAPSLPGKPKAAIARPTTSSVRLEYTDFSKLYGDRAVLTAETQAGLASATRVTFTVAEGQRRGGGVTTRATAGTVAVDHDWSGRLSTHSAVAIANNGLVFAQRQLQQDLSYKIGGGLVGTAGVKLASYGGGNDVATWSAGASYYLRGAMISYRYSLLASTHFGRSSAHLASLRVNDPAGNGATQLWVGHGSSLFEVELPHTATGRFTTIAVQRSQPLGAGIALNVGVNHGWYRTPTGDYRGNGVTAGLSFTRWPL